MTEVLFSILAFLVAISVLIAIHEFGKFGRCRRASVLLPKSPGCPQAGIDVLDDMNRQPNRS